MNDRPYILLATLDVHDAPRWWIRQRDGQYTDWDHENTVAAYQLHPVLADYMQFVGDWQAIAEIHNERLAKGVA